MTNFELTFRVVRPYWSPLINF